MMEHLERKIKDKLQQSSIEINTDELWNEVYPHIKPKKDRRAFIFILLGLFWLLSVVGVGWYFHDNDDEPSISNNLIEANEEQNELNEDKIISRKQLEENASSLDNVESIQTIAKEQSSVSSISNLKQTQSTIDQNRKIASRDIVETLANSYPEKSTQEKPTESVSFLKIPIENDDVSTYRKDMLMDKIQSSIAIAAEDKSKSNVMEDYFPTLILDNAIRLIEYDYPQPNIPNELSAYDPRSDYSRFSVYALGGVNMINRSLTATGTEPSADLVSRESNESPLESLSGELGLSYRFTDNLMLSAGFNYTRINEKIEDTYAVVDTVLLENVIIEYIISSRGSEPVYGNIQAERSVNTSLTAFNRYTDYSLSLDLTYFLNENRFTPYLSLGVQQSIRSTQSGFWLLDGSLYDLADDDSVYLSNNYGLAVRAGIGGQLALSQRTNLAIGARYTQYLNPITNQNYELKQRYSLLGINAGLVVKI